MEKRTVKLLNDCKAILGESPVWDDLAQVLYWVDIERGEIHSSNKDGENKQVHSIGQRIGCIALRKKQPGFIAGLERKIAIITLDPLEIQPLISKPLIAGIRYNDGKCDQLGQFWIGSCDLEGEKPLGNLYRINSKGTSASKLDPIICANGPAFSPDGQVMYYVDSYGKKVYQCALTATGEIASQTLFITFADPSWGYPDGLTCDIEGCIWIAHWGGGRVSHFSPSGHLLESISLPTTKITSCIFGGPDLQTLFITSASQGLTVNDNANGLAGAVFAIDLDIPGMSTARFDG